jgi:hypothetical protein
MKTVKAYNYSDGSSALICASQYRKKNYLQYPTLDILTYLDNKVRECVCEDYDALIKDDKDKHFICKDFELIDFILSNNLLYEDINIIKTLWKLENGTSNRV